MRITTGCGGRSSLTWVCARAVVVRAGAEFCFLHRLEVDAAGSPLLVGLQRYKSAAGSTYTHI